MPASERILVTGASGFLGTHMVSALAQGGNEVVAVDIEEPKNELPCEFHRSRVEDFLARIGNRRQFDTVFHFAAIVGGRTVIDGSPLQIAKNLELDRVVFDYIARVQDTRLVYWSSSAVYPVALQHEDSGRSLAESDVDIIEGRIGVPDNTYGWVKLTGEFTAEIVRPRIHAPILIYRPFSVYGPGQAESYPVTAIARRILAHQDPVVVWGSGQQVRDFVHIDDFVNLVMGTFRSGLDGKPMNIAAGNPVSFLEVASVMAEAEGYRPEIHPLEDMPTGVGYRVGDVGRIPPDLRPSMPLNVGFTSVLDWLRS